MTHLDRPLLIHVAASSEQRGRVVLASRTAVPNATAIAAAFNIAAAFETRVDCVLIECPDVLALAAHSFARNVSYAGQIVKLSDVAVKAGQASATESARRLVATVARARGMKIVATVARDSLADALARACAVEGPWNIVALAEPVDALNGRSLHSLLDDVSGATGIVCVGAEADTTSNQRPIIVVVEDLDRLPQMLRAAERLAQAPGTLHPRSISLLVAGRTLAEASEIEGHLRLLLSHTVPDSMSPITIAETRILHCTPAEVAEAVRQINGSFIIARSNGIAMDGDTTPILAVARCPLLFVR